MAAERYDAPKREKHWQGEWERRGLHARAEKGHLVLEVPPKVAVAEVLKDALSRRLEVLEVAPRYQSLEELFVSKAQAGD